MAKVKPVVAVAVPRKYGSEKARISATSPYLTVFCLYAKEQRNLPENSA